MPADFELPAPREDGVVSYYNEIKDRKGKWIEFPASIEVWVVSYSSMVTLKYVMSSFRPLSRYKWFPTFCFWLSASLSWLFVSGPSRGIGGFLRD